MSNEIETPDGSRIWHDPDHYESLCEPFASAAVANESVAAFADEVRALRDKYRLRDVVVCVEVTVAHEDSYVSIGGLQAMGDNARVIPMLQRGIMQMARTMDEAVPRWVERTEHEQP